MYRNRSIIGSAFYVSPFLIQFFYFEHSRIMVLLRKFFQKIFNNLFKLFPIRLFYFILFFAIHNDDDEMYNDFIFRTK